MSPVFFSESNVKLNKPVSMTDEECGPLAVYMDGTQCISCWNMSWKERIMALLFGRAWLSVFTGGVPQPPVWLQVKRKMFSKEKT